MAHVGRLLVCALALSCGGGPGPLAAAEPPAAPARAAGAVALMSFNILHSLNPLPPANWKSRRPLVWHLIRHHSPHVIALQEVLDDQLRDFETEFGQDYAWVGHGHSGPRSGEILPIAWRRDRFALVAHLFFWLSPTPDVVGSGGWGGRFPRVATQIRLREKISGRELVVVNTHWEADNELMEARRESARLLLGRTARLPADLPVFVVGDFNVIPTREKRREPYRMLTEDGRPPAFADAWLVAAERRGPDTTTNRLRPAPNLQAGQRKDWILFRGPVRISRVTVDDYHRGGIYPSDHLPVIAEFSWLPRPENAAPR